MTQSYDILLDSALCDVYGNSLHLRNIWEQLASAIKRGKDAECHLLSCVSRHTEIT